MVIKIHYTRFENSRYSILANVLVSNNRVAMEGLLNSHFPRTERARMVKFHVSDTVHRI